MNRAGNFKFFGIFGTRAFLVPGTGMSWYPISCMLNDLNSSFTSK